MGAEAMTERFWKRVNAGIGWRRDDEEACNEPHPNGRWFCQKAKGHMRNPKNRSHGGDNGHWSIDQP